MEDVDTIGYSQMITNNSGPWLPHNVPPEIVYMILTYQFRDFMRNDHPGSAEKYHENILTFLRSNLTVNRTFYHICRVLVYRYCNMTSAKRFHGLLTALKTHPELRNVVEVADFQELTSIGLGRTGEMNRMIRNLTNETVLQFLKLTNCTLREFLACESIQDDLDSDIIYMLLKPGTVLSVVDFCGCSGPVFTRNFVKAIDVLYEHNGIVFEEPVYNYQLTCLGLNDCTDLPSETLSKALRLFPELQKLDLSHTSLNDDTLINGLPHLRNLTHLSLAMCLHLTPRAVLEFFSHHPTITDENNLGTLEWLNLQVSPHTSSWTEVHVLFLLKKLCQFGHNKTLRYLNLNGLPLHLDYTTEITITRSTYYYQTTDTLTFIKYNFPNLKSLGLKDNNIPINKIVDFLTPGEMSQSENGIDSSQRLKFLNLANNPQINKWTIHESLLYTCSPDLVAIEVSFDAWQQIEKSNEKHEIDAMKYKNVSQYSSFIQDTANAEIIKWKCYIDSSYGRRYWIYKIDPYLNRGDLETKSNITRYDSEGHKIIEVVNQPDFLKFAQNKIMLGCGLVPHSGIRRKIAYRDLKPPISKFFMRNGGITMGSRPMPIVAPRLPPGGWRIIHNDDSSQHSLGPSVQDRAPPLLSRNSHTSCHEIIPEDDEEGISDMSSISSVPSIPNPIQRRDGLYLDRSMHDLHSYEQNVTRNAVSTSSAARPVLQEGEDEDILIETDEDYLNDPDLQRRRSQIGLFLRSRSKNFQIAGPSHHTSIRNPSRTRQDKPNFYDNPNKFTYDENDPLMTQRYRTHFELVNEYKVFGCVERGMYRYYSLKN